MKIAEAMNRIKSLRKELNDTDTIPFTEGTEVLAPATLPVSLATRQGLLREIARLKSLVTKTNVGTSISFNGDDRDAYPRLVVVS